MRSHRPNPCIAALLLAAVAGCASPTPEVVPAPLHASPAAPDPSIPARADPEAGASRGASTPAKASSGTQGSVRADRPATAARSGRTVATAPSADRAAPRPRAAGRTAAGAGPSGAVRDAPLPSESEGPAVTTYVFSDAPAPVRREAVRGEPAAPPSAARVPEGFNPYRIAYGPGNYRCELGRSVVVVTVAPDLRSTVLRWGDDDFTLRAVDARSGALRYEDPDRGLAWIVLKDRSMLLDTRAGQRLANACRVRG